MSPEVHKRSVLWTKLLTRKKASNQLQHPCYRMGNHRTLLSIFRNFDNFKLYETEAKLPSRTQATKTTKRNLKFKNSRLRRKKNNYKKITTA